MVISKEQNEVNDLAQQEISNRLQNEVDSILEQAEATGTPIDGETEAPEKIPSRAEIIADLAKDGMYVDTDAEGEDNDYSYGMGQ